MKYQDFEVLLSRMGAPPELRKMIQHLHAENVQVKDENKVLSIAVDKLIALMNDLGTLVGLHQSIFDGAAEGKSMQDIIVGMRSSHLVDAKVESER